MNKRVARGEATRARILRSATALFAKSGYEASSIEAVLAKAGISRGALYHHFADKEALFEAVLETVEARIAAAIVGASKGIADPVEALRAGCGAWLDLSRDRAVGRIVLIDAPAVLGWQKWREIDARFGFGLLKVSLRRAAAMGRISENLVEMLSHVFLASLMEIALVIARAADAERAMREGRDAVEALIGKLLGPPPRKRGNLERRATPMA